MLYLQFQPGKHRRFVDFQGGHIANDSVIFAKQVMRHAAKKHPGIYAWRVVTPKVVAGTSNKVVARFKP